MASHSKWCENFCLSLIPSCKGARGTICVETRQIQDNSQHPSVESSPLMSHTTISNIQQSLPPTHIILWCFSPNSSISLHPPSSHPPQVVCSVLSSTAWINDWCSRPQVKVRKVHYWIISALLSLLPSAWLLLVDVVEALEGTLFTNALKTRTHVCVCVSRVSCRCLYVFSL